MSEEEDPVEEVSERLELDPDGFREGMKSVVRNFKQGDELPDIIDEDALCDFVVRIAQEAEERKDREGDDD